ncbi:MAG TPA: hypothetical protein PKE21_02830 [Flavobacteriales bacterium]|nr:hypothetical protein [Flavobacteriales bacterium]HMR26391.1 hypothetical protein [Flavobacteriales bacterium]
MACSLLGFAQPDTTRHVHRIELDDGSLILGELMDPGAGAIRVRTEAFGVVEVPLKRVVRMERIDGPVPAPSRPASSAEAPAVRRPTRREVMDSVRWFRDRHATRYTLAPSALPVRRGEHFYRNTYLAIQSVHVAPVDHLELFGGLEVGSLLSLSPYAPGVVVGARTGWSITPQLHLGAAGLYSNTPYAMSALFDRFRDEGVRQGLFAGQGLLTVGNDRYHGTFSTGVRYHEWEGWETHPTYALALAARVIPRLWVVTDNWMVHADGRYHAWWSAGLRFVSRRVAVDLSFVNNEQLRENVFIGLPFISVCINMGRVGRKGRS